MCDQARSIYVYLLKIKTNLMNLCINNNQIGHMCIQSNSVYSICN